MAKKTKQPDAITIRYDLHELPTAQHKAGLAGLLLQIESMEERRKHGAELAAPPEVLSSGPTFAEIRFTAASTQAMFDDLYEATIEEALVPAKWPGTEPKDIREVEVKDKQTGKLKKEKRFVYDVVQPTGPFLANYTDGAKSVWHKLWRDMLWTVPRGRPTTRGPYNARSEGKSTKDGIDAWSNLSAFDASRSKGRLHTVEVAGAIMLGAQAVSAEGIGFEDRADHALLLHFWQLTARVFVPEMIDVDGKRQFIGFVLAVPEISDVSEFTNAYKRWLSELRPDKRGYRPADAAISLAAEGSLAFMYQLDRLASARALPRRAPHYLSGVEFFHMVKLGNNIKTASNGRVPATERFITKYDGLLSKGGPRNPLMLAARLRALLGDVPWFGHLHDDLAEREWSWFVHSTQDGHRTPPAMLGFAWDALNRFKQLLGKEAIVPEGPDAEAVDRVVYRLVKQYVREKASSRINVPTGDRDAWHKATHDPETGYERGNYQEARRHVAQGLFLALRSRREADFVEHFTATLGSVAQRLPENDYAILAAALMRPFAEEHGEYRLRTRDDVKTLTLLALSANSRGLTEKSESAQPAGDGEGE